jgi:hypothetical protein
VRRERGVRIAGLASEEFTEAVRWYETRRPGLGAELYDAVNATIEGIERQPEIGATAYEDPKKPPRVGRALPIPRRLPVERR